MQMTVRHIGLLIIGCMLGLGVLTALRYTSLLPTPLAQILNAQEHGSLASVACMPQAQEDDIFFVTCGGIY